MSQAAHGRVLAFLSILLPLSVAADILISRGTFGRAGSLAYMWCPGLAAFIASTTIKWPFSAIGWRLPKLKWVAAGWLIPLVCTACSTPPTIHRYRTFASRVFGCSGMVRFI